MERIAKQYIAAPFGQRCKCFCKLLVVCLGKELFRIPLEIGELTDGYVRWVEIYKIPSTCVFHRSQIISTPELRELEGAARRQEVFSVEEVYPGLLAKRGVELTAFVDPIESVEAGLVEVKKSGGPLDWGEVLRFQSPRSIKFCFRDCELL